MHIGRSAYLDKLYRIAMFRKISIADGNLTEMMAFGVAEMQNQLVSPSIYMKFPPSTL